MPPEIRSRPPSISGVNGFTFATACTQPPSSASGHVHRREEEHDEDRHLHQRPGLDRAHAHRDARRPERRDEIDDQREHEQPEQVDAVAVDLHPDDQRDREQQRADDQRARTSAASV